MSEPRTKYPVKTSLELTDQQDQFVEKVAQHLTELRNDGRRVSKKAAWRMFNDHCQSCVLFLESISMNTHISTDK